jgi:Na+-translocating ferredoxin:NAD+ oxidoreductase RNF subunit RnfB
MAYVITDTCTKDELCVQACPVDCIHPKQDEATFAEAPKLTPRRINACRKSPVWFEFEFVTLAGK